MKQILFFALKDDLVPMLRLVESAGPLKYTLMGNFASSDFRIATLSSGIEIPDLGKASADSTACTDAFIVCERDSDINLCVFQAVDNEQRICIDQLANPDSIEFRPGGAWTGNVILHGRVATASESNESQKLMKRFYAAIKKSFTKINAFHVGQHALACLNNGVRLTFSAMAPPEYDLPSGERNARRQS